MRNALLKKALGHIVKYRNNCHRKVRILLRSDANVWGPGSCFIFFYNLISEECCDFMPECT